MNAERPFRAHHYGALWFCYFAALGTYNPYAPLWLHSLGYSTLAIGAFAALVSWTRVLAPYGWGWLADHGAGRVRLLRWAAGLSLLSCLALWGLRDAGAAWLALAVAALFLANGAFTPLSEALVIKHLHDGDGLDAKRYARIRLWGSLGFISAVTVLGFIFQRLGIASLPLLTLAAFAAVAWATWRLPPDPPQVRGAAAPVPVWPVLRQRPVQWFFAGTMLTVLSHTGQYVFFSLYLRELGYSEGAIGLMWAASVLAEVAFFAFTGGWYRRVSDLRWLQWAALAAALRFACTAAAGQVVWVLVLMQGLHALSFAAHHMSCTSALGRYFPEALRGRGSGLYSTLGYGVPGVVGGLAGGALSQALGLTAVFWAAALAGLAGWACYVMCARSERG